MEQVQVQYRGVFFQSLRCFLIIFFHLQKHMSNAQCAGWQRWVQHLHTQANAHLIVVWTEVFEMAKAGVADTDEDSDAQDHQGEQRCGSPETWNSTYAPRHVVSLSTVKY